MDEVKCDLANKGFKVLEIKLMTRKHPEANGVEKKIVKLPLFLINFDSSVSIREVVSITSVCYCVVSWEKFRSYNKVTQCYNCQGYGHVSMNCFRKSKCMRCAGEQKSKSCTANKENIKCINCGLGHLSNSKECSIYNKIRCDKIQSTYQQRSTNSIQNVQTTEFTGFRNRQNNNTRATSMNYRDAVLGSK